jgi:CHAT domain-containing protein
MSRSAFFFLFITFFPFLLHGQERSEVTITNKPETEQSIMLLAGNLSKQAAVERTQGQYIRAFSHYLMALKSLNTTKSDSKTFLEFSYKLHYEVLNMADTLLDAYNNVGSRVVLSRFLAPVYEKAIDLGWKLYLLNPKDSYIDDAFYLVEKSRNLMLVEALKSSRITSFNGVPDYALKKQEQLRTGIFIYRNLLDSEYDKKNPDQKMIARYSDSLEFFQQQSDSLSFYIEKAFPEYNRLLHRKNFIQANEIQNDLKETDKALIEYYCGDSNIYIFVFTAKGEYLEAIHFDSTVNFIISEFQYAIIHSDCKLFVTTAFQIYKTVFLPAEKYLEGCGHIRIVPDGILDLIPFECLVKSQPEASLGYRDFDYLIKHYCFSYSPSAALLSENRQMKNRNTEMNMIAFAPGFSTEMKNNYIKICPGTKDSLFLSLPEQRWSLRFIDDISKRFDGKFFTDTTATAEKFKMEAGNYGIIHIASHSIFDEQNPMNARMIFAKSGCDTSDGYIYASDLYSMKMNASLAVLGSCRTGFGTFRKGEGMISLAYAFSYAGCPAMVYSLWEVDEKETCSLMSAFYDGIEDGLAKDEALHQAKLKLLEESNDFTANPYYWAGFIISGDEIPLQKDASVNIVLKVIFIAITGLIVIIFCFFLYKKWKKNAKG